MIIRALHHLHTAPDAPRSDVIQLLRFVAAALVLVTHATFYYAQRIDQGMPVWHGEMGVHIFFVISGAVMVVSSNRLAIDAGGARRFIQLRLLRIVPLYWLVTIAKIGIAIAAPAVVHQNHFEPIYAIKSLLFIPAYNAAGEIRPIHGVGWTLLHEMFFYGVFAVMMALRIPPAWGASTVICALCAAGLASPPAGALSAVATDLINLNFVVGMLIGCAMLHKRASGRSRMPALLAAALVTAAAVEWALPPTAAHFVLVDPIVLLVGGLLLGLADRQAPSALRAPMVLGSSSYALYLFHPLLVPPALILLHALATGLSAWAEILLTSALVVALSHVIYLWVETPLNAWAKRRFDRRLPAVPQVREPH